MTRKYRKSTSEQSRKRTSQRSASTRLPVKRAATSPTATVTGAAITSAPGYRRQLTRGLTGWGLPP